jgi:myo-inositol-1(or 4)-monophosphatase
MIGTPLRSTRDNDVGIPEPEAFLAAVEGVARSGAAALAPYWRSLQPSQITEKARNDLVSAADHASERAIIAAIGERFPDHSVLSEEAGWARRDPNQPTWIVDPLDGTTNFVHGSPHFAVAVAVMLDNRVDYGVIYDPIKEDLFTARRGGGAWWNGSPCRVSDRGGLRGALLATGFPFRAHELIDPYLEIFKEVFLRCKAIRRPGSATLDLAYTACGIFDGFFEFKLAPWDVAAGSLMVEEAGGTLTDMNGSGRFLDSGNVICGPPAVHTELAEITHRHAREFIGD